MNISQAAALLALLALLPSAARAERYRVDLIVFADRSAAAGESATPPRLPDLTRAYEPGETARLRAAGIEVVPDAQFELAQEWRRLQNSRLHEPVIRIAWIQKDPPQENGVGLRLRSGTPFAVNSAAGSSALYPFDGTITLLAGRYLHLDADFVATQRTTEGSLIAYRLQERRRLKRNELQHLDSPRLGILAKVRKAAESAPAAAPAAKKP